MAYDTLKTEIRQYIQTNGQQEITGQILQNVLLDMVNAYPSLDGYATQQWVQNQLGDMATMTWVGQQGFVTNSALADYLPLSGGVMTGFIIAGELSTGSYSLGHEGLSFSYSYNGSPRYAKKIDISSVNQTITFYGRDMTVGTVIGTSQITSDRFIVSNGTSSQFLKADGSVDNNTYLSSADLSGYATETWVGANYLPLSGGVMTGFIIAGELSTGSYSLGHEGLSFSYSYNGSPRYARKIDISSVNQTITFYGRDMTVGTVIGTSQITSDKFIVTDGTSAQFLKADGSVDSNTYLTSASISDMATQTWVGQQGFLTSVPSGYATETWVGNNYLPLTGGTLTGFIGAGTLSTGSYSLGNTGLSFEYSYNGNIRYAHAIRISSVDGTITFYGRGMIERTVIEESQITSDKFIVTNGTSAQFLKADGSVDSNTYLTSAAISDMATQTWVGQQGFLTSVPSGYATETWVGNNYLSLSGGTLTGGLTMNGAITMGTNKSIRFTTDDYVYLKRESSRLLIVNESGDDIIIGDWDDRNYITFFSDLQGGEGTSSYTSVLAQKWYILNNGSAMFSSVSQGSDIRYKTKTGDVDLSIEDIANAPLFKFTWKDGKDGNVHIGTSAQYWQGLMPELVSENKNGVLGMQYDVAVMAGIITVAKRVVDHEQRITELEKENALLKAKLNIN